MNGKRFAWQGIAKLPFIDESRLLAEVAKIEYTLTDEEVCRNSTMYDMLFVAFSHPLSPYIFSLDDCCKQLTDKERAQIKEKLDPGPSGGMNGFISLCGGDPCPSIFRSPVEGMEDIMDNQVICAIYRLPDAHQYITHPPPGVKPPKKTVTIGDLKPDPVLWHEDSGRKPRVNGRSNPQGTISGRQFGDAAHRLVVNSLQVKTDRNCYGDQYARPPSYAASHGLAFPSCQNNRHNEQNRMALPVSAHPVRSTEGYHRQPSCVPMQSQFEPNYGQPYALSAPRNSHNRYCPPSEKSELPVAQTRDYLLMDATRQDYIKMDMYINHGPLIMWS